MNLTEFRSQYPQYDGIDDDTLMKKLHEKFYADKLSYDDFKMKFSPPPAVSPAPVEAAPQSDWHLISKGIQEVKDIYHDTKAQLANLGTSALEGPALVSAVGTDTEAPSFSESAAAYAKGITKVATGSLSDVYGGAKDIVGAAAGLARRVVQNTFSDQDPVSHYVMWGNKKLASVLADSQPVQATQEWTRAVEKDATDALSPEYKAATLKNAVDQDEQGGYHVGSGVSDPNWWVHGGINMGVQLPFTAAAPALAARVAFKGALEMALATAAERKVPQSIALAWAQKKAAADAMRAARIAGGLSEGIISGAQDASQTEDTINQIDEQTLLHYQPYLDLRDQRMSHEKARAIVARQKALAVGISSAVVVGLTGAPLNAYIGKWATVGIKAGLVKRAGAAAGMEMGQEAVQGGAEQLIQNKEVMEIDPKVKLWDQVLNQAVSGGLISGLFGLVGGAGAGHGAKQQSNPQIRNLRQAETGYKKADAALKATIAEAQDPTIRLKYADLVKAREAHLAATINLAQAALATGYLSPGTQQTIAAALADAKKHGVEIPAPVDTSTAGEPPGGPPGGGTTSTGEKVALSAEEQAHHDALEAIATAQPVEPDALHALVGAGLAKVSSEGQPVLLPAGRRERKALAARLATAEEANAPVVGTQQSGAEATPAENNAPISASNAPKQSVLKAKKKRTSPKSAISAAQAIAALTGGEEPTQDQLDAAEARLKVAEVAGHGEGLGAMRTAFEEAKVAKTERDVAKLKATKLAEDESVPAAAPRARLKTEAKHLPKILRGRTTIITAVKTGMTPKQIADVNERLSSRLARENIPHQASAGGYRGQPEEPGFIVKPESLEHVEELRRLARYADQESVLEIDNHGNTTLHYTDASGKADVDLGRWREATQAEALASEGYTKHNGQYYIAEPIPEPPGGFYAEALKRSQEKAALLNTPKDEPNAPNEVAAKRGRLLGTQKKKMLRFRHFSPVNQPTLLLNPARMGTGVRGAESERNGPKVSAFYGEKGPIENDSKGMTEYHTEVPADEMYDANADPLNLAAKATVPVSFTLDAKGKMVPSQSTFSFDKYEELIKKAGFRGYYMPKGEGMLRGQARMFDKTNVTNTEAPPPRAMAARAKSAAVQMDIATALKKVAGLLTPQEKVVLNRATAKRLVDLFDELPDEKDLAAAAIAGQAKRGWYEQSAKAISNIFGPDAPRFTALLAAMSPQTSVQVNLQNAVAVWAAWVKAGRPIDFYTVVSKKTGEEMLFSKSIERIMFENVKKKKPDDPGVLRAWVPNAIRSLTTETPDTLVLSGPKVDSFSANLRGETNRVTLDAWMANFAHVDQTLFSGSLNKSGPGAGPGYLAFSARVRQAAQYLTKKTGDTWAPSEVQEAVWSWAKTLYEKTSEYGGMGTAQDILNDGEITDALINSTPDFITQFTDDPLVERVLREAGYGDRLDQLVGEKDTTGNGREKVAPLKGDSARLLRAAGRLDKTRIDRDAAAAEKAARKSAPPAAMASAAKSNPQTLLPAFKRWFGKSKVVDAKGKPLVVYHGTRSYFTQFDGRESVGWFSEEPKLAETYADSASLDDPENAEHGTGQRIMPVYLSIQKPLDLVGRLDANDEIKLNDLESKIPEVNFDGVREQWGDDTNPGDVAHGFLNNSAFFEALQEAGYDGLTITERGIPTWAVGKPSQVKSSTGNNGKFSPKTGNIMASAAKTKAGGFTFTVEEPGPKLLAPNGMRSNLTPEQHRQVRTAAFKKWFGDWEHWATQESGVWADGKGEVSKVVDANGEPLVVYHATRRAGFREFDPAERAKGYTPAVFFAAHLDTALTYSGRSQRLGRSTKEVDLPPLESANEDTNDTGHAGYYPVFLNIRHPNEAHFEGANWDGSREGQMMVVKTDADGEQETQHNAQGVGYFHDRDRAYALAMATGGEVVPAVDVGKTTNSVVAAATRSGNDGAIIRDVVDSGAYGDAYEPTDVFAIFNGTQVKSATQNVGTFNPSVADIAMSVAQPAFYSRATRVAESLSLKSASAAQWLATLKNQPGVRQDELDYMGLKEWLGGQNGNVSKDDLLAFMRANSLQITETMRNSYEANSAANEEMASKIRAELIETHRVINPGAEPMQPAELEARVREVLRRTGRESQTLFDTYQTPGGSNYRELLIQLPPRTNAGIEDQVARLRETTPGMDEAMVRVGLGDGGQNYQSGHYPGESNIIAHVRMNEHTSVDGKRTLFIEEVQSDWHQKGRVAGYSTPERTAAHFEERRSMGEDIRVLKKERNTLRDSKVLAELHEDGSFTAKDLARLGELNDELRALELRLAENVRRTVIAMVPDAPFKTTWPELAMKRMIRYAAENGFHQIAWTTGEMQNERYALSQYVDEIVYAQEPKPKWLFQRIGALPDHPATYRVLVHKKEGANRWHTYSDIQMSNPSHAVDIERLLGKEIASRIANNEGELNKRHHDPAQSERSLSGLNLEIGGEGMKGFYDKILPATVDKYVKKWGAKTGETQIYTTPEAYDIDMVSAKFATAFGMRIAVHGAAILNIAPTDNVYVVQQGAETVPGSPAFQSRKEAQAWIAAHPLKRSPTTVHALELNDKMQEAAMEGQPMFSTPTPTWAVKHQLQQIAVAQRAADVIQRTLGVDVTVVVHQSQLPDAARVYDGFPVSGLFVSDPTDENGGRLYLVASNLKDYDDALETALHESVGHLGLRALLGNQYNAVMDSLFRSFPAQARDAATRNEIDIDHPNARTRLRNRRLAAEEMVAYASGILLQKKGILAGQKQRSIWRKIVDFVMKHLRMSLAEKGLLKESYTPEDLESLIYRARDFVHRKNIDRAKAYNDYAERVEAAAAKGKPPVERDFFGHRIAAKGQNAALHAYVVSQVKAVDPTAYRQKSEGGGATFSSGQTTMRVDRDKLAAVKALPDMPRFHVEAGTYPYMPAMIVYTHWPETFYDEHGKERAPTESDGRPTAMASRGRPLGSAPNNAALDSFLNKIGSDKVPLKERWKQFKSTIADKIAMAAFDHFHGIKRASDLAGVSLGDAGYYSARLSGNSAELVQSMMEYGHPVWNGGAPDVAGGMGFLDILKPLGNNVNMWLAYMVGKRAQRLAGEGRENLFEPHEIQAALDLEKQHPEFKQVAARYAEFQKKVLDFAEEAGIINPDSRALWENQDYIPFYRLVENGQVQQHTNAGKGIGYIKNQIVKLKGGKANMGDPMENIVRNWLALMDASLKAVAARTVADGLDGTGLVTKMPLGPSGPMLNQVTPAHTIKDFVKNNPVLVQSLKSIGVDVNRLSPAQLRGLQQQLAVPPPAADGVITIWRNGQREHWAVHDDMLFQSLQGISAKSWGPLMEILRAPKRWLTATVTITPQFLVKNVWRDMWHTFIIGTHEGKTITPLVDTIKGTINSMKMDKAAQSMLAGGGSFAHGWIYGGDTASGAAAIRRTLKAHHKGTSVILDTPLKMFRFYRKLQNASENANRVAIYKKAIADGRSRIEALYEARDILDFNMRGNNAIMRFLTEAVPFLNARLQGLYRLGRGVTKKTAAGMFLRGALLAAASLALLARNWKDDRYKELSDDQKSNYWHLWDVFQKGDHWQIPKPFETGAVFGTIPEIMGDAFLTNSDEPDKAAIAANMVAYTFGQQLNLSPHPAAIWPLVELATNKNSYTGAPILTQGDQGILPEDQVGPNTSPTFRTIAQSMPGFMPEALRSPKQLEFLARAYIGNVQDYVLLASDKIARTVAGEPETPRATSNDWPGIRDFRKVGPATHTKYMDSMYDIADKADMIYKSLNKAREANTDEGDKRGDQIEDENQQLLDVRGEFQQAAKQVTDLKKQQREIQLDPGMTPDDKRAQIDLLQEDINQTAADMWDLRPGGKLNLAVGVQLLAAPQNKQADVLRKNGLPATADLLNQSRTITQ